MHPVNEHLYEYTHDVIPSVITPPPPHVAVQLVILQSEAVYEDAYLQSTAPPSLAEQEVNVHRVSERVVSFLFSDIAPPLYEVVVHPVNVQSVKEEEEEIDWREVYVCDVISSFGVDSEKEW